MILNWACSENNRRPKLDPSAILKAHVKKNPPRSISTVIKPIVHSMAKEGIRSWFGGNLIDIFWQKEPPRT